MIPESPRHSRSSLTIPSAELAAKALFALDQAKSRGATQAEVEVSQGVGLAISVRKGEVETIEHTRDKGISVTVYVGQRRGNASSTDFASDAITRTVEAALAIARHTGEDDAAGLADPEQLASAPFRDLGLYHPWSLKAEAAIEIAKMTEAAGLAVDPRITNSEGASVSFGESEFVYANSHGFIGGYPGSRASISCALIAEDGHGMQRDYWYTSERNPDRLEAPEAVGRRAAERVLARLSGRKVPTQDAPVLFDATLAGSLVGSLVGAASGGSLYRKSSFLLDKAGESIFPEFVTIEEDPDIREGQASSPFDGEGVRTRKRLIVDRGVLTGYFLGSYTARKLGLTTTGNAGGSHNLTVRPTAGDRAELIRTMGRGLLVTELMGQGTNLVTGDYSRGASGFWVENGEIQYPVEELTIAGNLATMYQGIVGIGSDTLIRGSKRVGSILVDRMTIAGEGADSAE
jgi:PmbA protein